MTGRTRARVLALGIAGVCVVAACGGDSDDAASTTTAAEASTTSEAPAETTSAPPTTGEPATVVTETTSAPETSTVPATTTATAPGESPCSGGQAPDGGEYVVTNIPADDPDGGLVARLEPGTGGERIGVLPEGTIVDSDADRPGCVVTSDGGVWWSIDSQPLAAGGWVNSRFLAPFGDGSDPAPEETGEDDFDIPLTQVACVYDGFGEACDLLVTFGIGTPDDNYGLGNSYSQAPDDAIVEQCTVEGDAVACAEGEARGLLSGE